MVKRSLQAANNAARRIDARQIFQFQKWNWTQMSTMVDRHHAAARFASSNSSRMATSFAKAASLFRLRPRSSATRLTLH
jgi:hypothetical protein